GRTRCSPPRLHPREEVAELAVETASGASPLDPSESIVEVARLEIQEVHEGVVAEQPPERARVPLRVADRLGREAEGEPGPLEERRPRAGCDEDLAVGQAAGRPSHGGREQIELAIGARLGGPRADEPPRRPRPPTDPPPRVPR